MLRSILVSGLTLFLILPGTALTGDGIDGAYERVSLVEIHTGKSPETANRKGLLILADGHYSMMTMNPDRRYVEESTLTEMSATDQVAYFREWLDINGHTGRYETKGSELTWYRDISENPREVGTVSTFEYEITEELLIIYFQLPNGDRYAWTWRRL